MTDDSMRIEFFNLLYDIIGIIGITFNQKKTRPKGRVGNYDGILRRRFGYIQLHDGRGNKDYEVTIFNTFSCIFENGTDNRNIF